MKLFKFIYPNTPSMKETLLSLVQLPKTFVANFKKHIWILLPLIATQFFQRFQDVLDNRWVGALGSDALAIHSIQSNFYLIGQEIGLASAFSALIFWKRKEAMGRQGSLLKLHLAMPIILAGAFATTVFSFSDDLIRYY